ncbi:hypothetical protein [Adhaeribacter pallidiroseus]|uniref:Uncharacterized protein n=1 Tax=Adhaeribacter pallidiroseus TaxID=2072847 RepID=A0A369QBE7_9BACT|nr:hypothetical protein [Adhaeribacter pallidiroseus]RDC62034.1 hypothetical protein AHMF7616_00624 [Adhaeribacter pallidiroseus]
MHFKNINWKEFLIVLLISIFLPASIIAGLIYKAQHASIRNGNELETALIGLIASFFLTPIILFIFYFSTKDYKDENADNSGPKGFLFAGLFWVIIDIIVLGTFQDILSSHN